MAEPAPAARRPELIAGVVPVHRRQRVPHDATAALVVGGEIGRGGIRTAKRGIEPGGSDRPQAGPRSAQSGPAPPAGPPLLPRPAPRRGRAHAAGVSVSGEISNLPGRTPASIRPDPRGGVLT